MKIVEPGPEHVDPLSRFFAGLPAGDLTFIHEDVTDPARVRAWAAAGGRWLVLKEDGPEQPRVAGYLAVQRLPGWSDHVGEIRLVVHAAHRRAGVGRALARHALVEAVQAGLR